MGISPGCRVASTLNSLDSLNLLGTKLRPGSTYLTYKKQEAHAFAYKIQEVSVMSVQAAIPGQLTVLS